MAGNTPPTLRFGHKQGAFLLLDFLDKGFGSIHVAFENNGRQPHKPGLPRLP